MKFGSLHRAPSAVRTVSVRRSPPRSSITCHSAVNVKDVLEELLQRKDLNEARAQASLDSLLTSGDTAQIAAFLVLLRAKGETAEEIAGLAKGMLARAVRVPCDGNVVDIVGTGGDGIGSVNISTGASVVAAAAGAKVAKHGNRSSSSLCGSADVLEALGVSIELGPEGVARCIDEASIGFMFAPTYHPAMRAVTPVRRALKVRTIFNVLGPLLNPAGARYGLIGVYTPAISDLMGDALQRVGVDKALVVHSGGLDELTPLAPADVVEVVTGGPRKRYTVDPLDLGIPRCTVTDLQGGDATLNAKILRDVFGGAKGAVADALNLNAGVALAACKVAKDVKEGVAMAREAQQSGRAGTVLTKWVEVSQREIAKEKAKVPAAAKA